MTYSICGFVPILPRPPTRTQRSMVPKEQIRKSYSNVLKIRLRRAVVRLTLLGPS